MVRYNAIRVHEETKDRWDDEVPDDMTHDQFLTALLDLYDQHGLDLEDDPDDGDDENQPAVSNDDLLTAINQLPEKMQKQMQQARY